MAKILLIEDEKAMSDLVSIRFRVEGFEVDQANNLAEAKQYLAKDTKYNAILTDYLLPDGDLIDFLTTLRANVAWKDLPVVVMTNYVEDLNNDKLKALGVLDIFTKYQVVPAQMVARIKQILNMP